MKKNDDPRSSPFSRSNGRSVKPLKLDEITAGEEHRVPLYDKELTRVLGGGLVRIARFVRWRTWHREINTHASDCNAGENACVVRFRRRK